MSAGERNCYEVAKDLIARYGWANMLRGLHELAGDDLPQRPGDPPAEVAFGRALDWPSTCDLRAGLARAIVAVEG